MPLSQMSIKPSKRIKDQTEPLRHGVPKKLLSPRIRGVPGASTAGTIFCSDNFIVGPTSKRP